MKSLAVERMVKYNSTYWSKFDLSLDDFAAGSLYVGLKVSILKIDGQRALSAKLCASTSQQGHPYLYLSPYSSSATPDPDLLKATRTTQPPLTSLKVLSLTRERAGVVRLTKLGSSLRHRQRNWAIALIMLEAGESLNAVIYET